MKQRTILNLLLIITSILLSCSDQINNKNNRISIKSEKFVDSDGREVVFNGINLVNKNPEDGYVWANDPQTFKKFKEYGFNLVRYGIHWDRLEHCPGVFDTIYLQEIDKRVQMAKDNGMWIYLDLHQDLYGRKLDNGAPDWATLDNGAPHIRGQVWSDSYMISPAVQNSFDNFWSNSKAIDGVGLQDHYIKMLKLLIDRYNDEPTVLGIDVMNEPFNGSSANEITIKLFEGFAKILSEVDGIRYDELEIMDIWADPAKRAQKLEAVNDTELYRSIIESAQSSVDDFERGLLSDFYQKICDSIACDNLNMIIFLEHSYFCNLGIESRFVFPKNNDGSQNLSFAYAPHGYDLVTDTDAVDNPGDRRVEVIFNQIEKSANSRNVPYIVGEWGAFPDGNFVDACRDIITIYENKKISNTFWCWTDTQESQSHFNSALVRIYPMAVNGELDEYKNNWEDRAFKAKWRESHNNKSSRFYIPSSINIDKTMINISPSSNFELVKIDNSNAFYLDIESKNGTRELIIKY